jgi:hypothetical protein
MAQHDYVIANGTGAAVRSDLNNALAAIVSQNSGATTPSTTYAYQWWADTTTGLLKLRNAANSAWITLFQLDGEWSTIALENGTAAAPSIYFKDSGTDTGFYSPGTDQVGISTGGTARLTIDSNGNVNIDSNTLYVDAANNRVGLGTSSPSAALHVATSGAGQIRYFDGTVTGAFGSFGSGNEVFLGSGKALAFTTNGITSSETRMTIDTSGRVGIGTTSPGAELHVNPGAGNVGNIYLDYGTGSSTDGRLNIEVGSSAVLYETIKTGGLAQAWYVTGAERARIDTAGRFLVGTSSAPTVGDAQYANLVLRGYAGGATGDSFLALLRGQAPSSIASGAGLGSIVFGASDGSPYATITGNTDGTGGSGDYPGRLVFSTTADGASSPTERMRISNDGDAFIGKTGFASGTAGIELQKAGAVYATRDNNLCALFNRLSSDGTLILFQRSTTSVGSITVTSSSTGYNTSSDYRLKENVVPLVGAADRINQLQVHRFNFIADPDTTVDGFIAHEAQAVVPECVTGTKDEVDADGNPVYQGIDQSKLVPLLTAALQEALQKIEDLEGRLTAAGI